MRWMDLARFSLAAISRARVRSLLLIGTVAIGSAAMVVLTAVGDSAKDYVVEQFAVLGSQLVMVFPGKSETAGGALNASFGGTVRPLTLDDAAALTRHHQVIAVAPVVMGAAGVQYAGLEREAPVLGGTPELLQIRRWKLAAGQFSTDADWDKATPVCVVGDKLARELFGSGQVVGQWLRIGDSRFRVAGVFAAGGRSLGMDLEDLVLIPVADALRLFDTESLFQILLEVADREDLAAVERFALATLRERHRGEEDVTVVTQDALLGSFDQLFNALNAGVLVIAGVSLAVAGVLIMNVMLIAVSQRTAEIGLLKAIGATGPLIARVFFAEAILLSAAGALLGLLLAQLLCFSVRTFWYPELAAAPGWAMLTAAGVAMTTGMISGLIPARRAARLEPLAALGQH